MSPKSLRCNPRLCCWPPSSFLLSTVQFVFCVCNSIAWCGLARGRGRTSRHFYRRYKKVEILEICTMYFGLLLHNMFCLCITAENWLDSVLCKITTEEVTGTCRWNSSQCQITFHRMCNGSLCSTCSCTSHIVSVRTVSTPGTPNRADDSICQPLRMSLNHGTHWLGNLGRTNWFPAWCPVPVWRRKCNQDDRKG